MARNSACSDNVTNTQERASSPNLAVSDNSTSTKKAIEYQGLMNLVSQELPGADSNLLENPIHPIFQKENWQISVQGAWPQLQPAIRLASRFIGEDDMLAFWYNLVWGTQKMHDESEKFGHTLERFSAEGARLNISQKERIDHWLRDFGEKQQNNFFKFKAGVRLGRTTRKPGGGIVVELQWELLELLRDHSNRKRVLSETQLLRLNFLIAVLLLHELGHSIRLSISRSKYEPYYGDHVVAEVGHAWTCWAFGGVIAPVNMLTKEKPACFDGFWVATPPSPWQNRPLSERWPARFPRPPALGDLPKRATCWILATEYIQRVQTEKFWEDDIKVHGVGALHVPPTDGNHKRPPFLNTSWKARVTMSRGPNDEMMMERCFC